MKVYLVLLMAFFVFNARSQDNTNVETLNSIRMKMDGKWKHDRRFRGKLWYSTFSFSSDSAGTWLNNRTRNNAPNFSLWEKDGKFYIAAFDFLGGECEPREVFFLNRRRMILKDPKTQEEFKYKRLGKWRG